MHHRAIRHEGHACDDGHRARVTVWAEGPIDAGQGVHLLRRRACGRHGRGRGVEQASALGQTDLLRAVGEKADVPDAWEMWRHDVEQLCGGANYVARPSATPTIPQR